MAEAMTGNVSPCPDLETIGAYLDDRLTARAREEITAHLASCETCYALFCEAVQTHTAHTASVGATVHPTPVPLFQRAAVRRAVWASAGVLGAAACLVVAVGIGRFWRLTPEEPGLQALVAAVGTERTVEPRLSGGFAYGPLRGPVRAGEATAPSVSPDVRIAAAQIEKHAIVRRTPQALKALGIAYLVLGDVNRAVPVLEEAADQPTPDARILNDLSAAYLVRATRYDQPQDLAKALATADRATKADRRLAEAWFNRAYALERLSLTDEARRAWQDYLKVDDRSDWASEARTHLRELETRHQSSTSDDKSRFEDAARRGDTAELRRNAEQSPDVAREWLQDEVLVAWPRAIAENRGADARTVLDVSHAAAAGIMSTTGDPFTANVLRAIALASHNARLASELARAHTTFSAASMAYSEDRIRDSMPQFEAALEPLTRLDSPFAVSTRLNLAIGRYYAADLDGAEKLLVSVIQTATDRHYTRVLGLAHRMHGLIKGVRGDFAGGLQEYRTATACFERVRDIPNEASLHALSAEVLDFLGEPALVWAELVKGLSQLSTVADRRHHHLVLQNAALAALRQGLTETAAYFQAATLKNAERWGRPLAVVNARLYQGEILQESGDSDKALTELAAAQEALSTVPDPQLIARDEPRIQLAQGEAQANRRPGEAVEILSTALAGFEKARRNWPVARVRLARARAHLAEGRDDLAEADLTAGIELFEQRRAAIADEALRSASFEQPWDLYTEMIRLQAITRHRPDRALLYAERARARTLVEAISPTGETATVDPNAGRTQLPPSVTLLYYVALDDRLLIWVMDRAHTHDIAVSVRQAELEHLVQQYRSEMLLSSIAARDTPSLSRLYDLLIRPVADRIPEGSELVIVPDGVLHAVPFAALIRRDDRRFLIEEHAIKITPSVTLLLAQSPKTQHSAPTRTALVIGNPRLEGADAEVAPNLPEAETEAKQIATLYSGSTLLIGADATRQAFLSTAGQYEVIHFAGHAVANDAHPDLSRLLFAGDGEASGSLFARDIAQQPFAATRLVVLGACRTSAGRIRRGEGVFSLARPFLAAGVPAVVASLWDVNDRASRRLLVAFHSQLRQSANPTEALRKAQLELMADADPLLQSPAAWAGFTLIGSD